MEFVSPIFDLYSDYLLINQGQPTATRLAALVDGKLSHDAITRSLHQRDYDSRHLWQVVKPFVHQIAQADGVLIFDDNLEEKPYMATNPLIRYHFDHCQGRTIKGINQLTALYHSASSSLPVAYELIQKDQQQLDPKTGKIKWVSRINKHQLLRRMVKQCITNDLNFKYILADCWYSCADTFTCINGLLRHFIMPVKANRKVALSQLDHQQGCYQSIESLALEESQLLVVWLKGVAFPLHLTRQVRTGGLVQRRRHHPGGTLSGDRTGGPAMTRRLIAFASKRSMPAGGKSRSFTNPLNPTLATGLLPLTLFAAKATICFW